MSYRKAHLTRVVERGLNVALFHDRINVDRLRAFPRSFFNILRESLSEFLADNAPHLAAALAFYTVMSLAPLAIIAVAMATSIFGKAAASGEIVAHIQSFIGAQAAIVIEGVIGKAWTSHAGVLAAVVSAAILVAGSTAIFAELNKALNTVWEVRSAGSFSSILKTRFLSFLIVLGIGFLLLVALLANAGLAIAITFVKAGAPRLARLLFLANAVLPFVVTTVLFAMFFKVLPDVNISWRDLWVGALITSLLFILGKYLLGFYLGRRALGSAYGAAGSLFVFLLWVYYSAQIFLFGAEITHVYARHAGRDITPARGALAAPREGRKENGPDEAAGDAPPGTMAKKAEGR